MTVVFCGICPHPPIAVPEVGGDESVQVEATRQALLELGRRIRDSGAETVVIISPHATVFRNVIGINTVPVLQGDLGRFLASEVKFERENDLDLAGAIKEQAAELGLEVLELTADMEKGHDITLDLDHGVTVPLYFLQKAGVEVPLVHVSMAVGPPERLCFFGQAVRRAARSLGRKTALLASGDLSHCLAAGAPGGYNPRGAEFDRKLAALLAGPDAKKIIKMDPALVRQAAECGYHAIVMMLGALDGYELEAEVLSYEGPFGVGYLVAAYRPAGIGGEQSFLNRLQSQRREEVENRRAGESFLVRLARETLERHVKRMPRPEITGIPEEFKGRAGTFVSIKKHGVLRGCIGTIEPVTSSIVDEVMANAVKTGVHDPRFQPVQKQELDDLEYSVDVLQPPEPVTGVEQLDPGKYGVIVRAGAKKGLLLPDLEGVDSAGEQVAIVRQKAGIGPDEPVMLERFKVARYK